MRRLGYRTQRYDRAHALVRVLALTLVFGVLIYFADAQLRPTIEVFSTYQAKVFATKVVNDAIAEALADESIRYDNLVTLSRNGAGDITSIETDMVALNQLRSQITEVVLAKVAEMENQRISVPAGTLSGFQMLSGRGPKVNFKVVPTGYLQTQMENRFDAAGINQTRHQIMLGISLQVSVLIPGYTSYTDITTSYCLAETVIVGVVPEAFTQVVGDESSMPHLVYDYGASK